MTFSWEAVTKLLRETIADPLVPLDDGQRASLAWMCNRIGTHGIVLADEVGTGKTRIACAIVDAVVRAGGRAAVVVPQGLMHQWSFEAARLKAPAPHPLTSLKDFMSEARTDLEWEKAKPRPDAPEWWLVSHGFRVPLVRRNSPYVWRAALPSFVRLQMAPKTKRDDGRTKFGRLQKELDETRESWWGWNGMGRIARDVAQRIKPLAEMRKRIEALPRINVTSWDNEKLLAEFVGDGEGRRITEQIVGLWLGEFDLIVVDEAHKSRGTIVADDVGAVDATVLTRLVDGILKQPIAGRRLCMTATPMELELEQWLDLLARAQCHHDAARCREVIEELGAAAEAASIAPDEITRLDDLCRTAKQFKAALEPYVTRRRRDEDDLIKRFRAAISHPAGVPHPHRKLSRVGIDWSEIGGVSSSWLNVLFAAECMSQAARGLSNADTADWPKAVRDAYTKLADGHVSIDLTDTSEVLRVPAKGDVDEYTRGKIARVAYWYRRLREARTDVAASVDDPNFDPDCDHPRISAAVKEIEAWTGQGEKVLVFGVFLQPLRHLRDVLNVREALRAADEGRPISHAIHSDPKLLAIAIRQSQRMRADSSFRGTLRTAADPRDVLSKSHKAYERIRPRVRENAQQPLKKWRDDSRVLAGIKDVELDRALHDHFVGFALDHILAGTTELVEPTPDHVRQLAGLFIERYLHPLIDELESGEKDAAETRRERLREALLEDHDGRQSLHARLLQGSTGWATRRYLQAAFNRRGAAPRVLIAQSQVGREGLNLHEACRVVVQFHAEWNPAILEQQIGRVDRKGSHWEALARQWLEADRAGEPKFIEVRQLIFEGTYDAFKWDRVARRQRAFDASLFGSLLPSEAWRRVPEGHMATLVESAPSFQPPPYAAIKLVGPAVDD